MDEAKTKLFAALAKAQGEIKNAPMNRTNPHFKARYADLSAVRDAVTPALSKNGLSVTHQTGWRDGAFVLITTLHHEAGGELESLYPLPLLPDRPQQMGSAISYARRYCLAALTGIASDEDDDGNAAQDDAAPAGKQAAPSRTVQQPPAQRPPKADQIRVQVPDTPGPIPIPGQSIGHAEAWFAALEITCLRGSADTNELRQWWEANLPTARDLAERHQRPLWVTKLTAAKDEVKRQFEEQEGAE